MKLTGKLTKESKSLSAALSPRSGGGKVVDVVYGSASGESVVNDEGVAIIPPYPTIPPIPVKGVMQGQTNLVDNNGIARVPEFPNIPVKGVVQGDTNLVDNQGIAHIPQITYDVLYHSDEVNNNIILDDDLYDYDFILLTAYVSANVNYTVTQLLYTDSIIDNKTTIGFTDDGSFSWYIIADGTHINFFSGGGNRYIINDVIGLKFGG